MGFDDTGLCIPETRETLEHQQSQLIQGHRNVQMFPIGTAELTMPYSNIRRLQTDRGVFHYRCDRITESEISKLSAEGRENEFLNLGPISKAEVAERVQAGETLLCVTEYKPEMVAGLYFRMFEVRSAAGTESTIDAQRDYFERTKEPNNIIEISDMLPVLGARLAGMN